MDSTLLTEEQFAEIDFLLLDNNPLWAVKRIRELTGLGLHDSGSVMRGRYEKLREQFPDKFSLTDQEYWSGWYS